MRAAMQPLPHIAGATSAATGCIQIAIGAVASGFAAEFYDGRSALSMIALPALRSLLALVSYRRLARPSECVVASS
jgi:MFS transporter, DHA1 family, multidrug resistance protein